MESTTLTQQYMTTLEQLSIDLMAAWKRRDRDVIDNLLHHDFYFVNDTIKEYCVNKEIWMEWLLGKFELVTFHYNFQKINLSSDNTMAIVISKLSTFTRPNYTDAQRIYLNTDIWVRDLQSDSWKLILRQPVSSSFV